MCQKVCRRLAGAQWGMIQGIGNEPRDSPTGSRKGWVIGHSNSFLAENQQVVSVVEMDQCQATRHLPLLESRGRRVADAMVHGFLRLLGRNVEDRITADAWATERLCP